MTEKVIIVWCADLFGQWEKAHAVAVEDEKLAHLSLCGIRPYGGWGLSSKEGCKNCIREREKLVAMGDDYVIYKIDKGEG